MIGSHMPSGVFWAWFDFDLLTVGHRRISNHCLWLLASGRGQNGILLTQSACHFLLGGFEWLIASAK